MKYKIRLKVMNQQALVKRAIKAIGGDSPGAPVRAAEKIGVSRQVLDKYMKPEGHRDYSRVVPEMALQFEKVSNGKVTLNNFYPEMKSNL